MNQSMSRQKAKDEVQKVLETHARAEWDPELHEELYGGQRCFKCGSVDFNEILDMEGDLVLCCNECPEIDAHH